MPLDKKRQEDSYYSKKFNPPHESPPLVKTICILLFSVLVLLGLDLYAETHFFSTEGPLSSSHAHLAGNCENCHTQDWTRSNVAMQEQCVRCHTDMKMLKFHVSSHQRLKKEKRVFQERFCVDCHKEHKGRNYETVSNSDLVCKDCHSINHVSTEHPDFNPGKLENADLRDIGLHFNHQIHQKNDKNKDEMNKRFENGCPLCHKLDPENNFQDFKPTSFTKNCRDCHPLQKLTITKMFPEEELESLALSINEMAVKFGFESHDTFLSRFEYRKGSKRRRRPSSLKYQPSHEDPYLNLWFSQESFSPQMIESIMKQGRKGATLNCLKCHILIDESKPANSKLKIGENNSLASIGSEKRGTTITRFHHKKHFRLSCENCHGDILKSETLEDKNLKFNKNTCFSCHDNILVKNECSMCHNFHQVMNQQAIAKMISGNRNMLREEKIDNRVGTNDDS